MTVKPKPPIQTRQDWRVWSKTAILLGMGIYLFVLIITGNLSNYINLRFAWLAYVGAGIFVVLGLINLYGMFVPQDTSLDAYLEQPKNYDITWGMILIVAFPLLLAVLVPSRPLGVEAVNGGISLSPVGVDSASAFTRDPLDRNVLDWLRAFNRSETPAEFNGQLVDVTGFIYREPNFLDTDFMVARFTMSCCVADAYPIGLPVTADDAKNFDDGVWVRVQGKLKANDFDENFVPVVYASTIELIDPPQQPYLYP